MQKWEWLFEFKAMLLQDGCAVATMECNYSKMIDNMTQWSHNRETMQFESIFLQSSILLTSIIRASSFLFCMLLFLPGLCTLLWNQKRHYVRFGQIHFCAHQFQSHRVLLPTSSCHPMGLCLALRLLIFFLALGVIYCNWFTNKLWIRLTVAHCELMHYILKESVKVISS